MLSHSKLRHLRALVCLSSGSVETDGWLAGVGGGATDGPETGAGTGGAGANGGPMSSSATFGGRKRSNRKLGKRIPDW